MKIKDVIKMALAGVSTNKFRSFLTLLGIIIGVGAVIIMVSLGSGTQKVVSGQFEELLTRQIWIGPNYNLPYHQRGLLTPDDEEYLELATIGIEDVLPFYNSYMEVTYGSRSARTTIAGIVPGADEITNLEVKYGRTIEEADLKNRSPVAVVGQRFLERITDIRDFSSLIGEEIKVNGEKFLIAGIIEPAEASVGLSDRSVLIPLTTFKQMWRGISRSYNFFLVTYDKNSSEQDIVSQIEFLLNKKYGLPSSGQSRFLIEGLQRQVNIMNNVVKIFTFVLGGIAAISLLVGGIGIMNIMLVNVKERTREIGIRLAIGATREDIQKQFLAEAVILSAGGGVLGIICGSLLSFALNFALSKAFHWWQGSIPLFIILLSFAVTASIGIIFGFYPAYRASKLDPIQALRK